MARSSVECTVAFEMENKTTEVLKYEKKKKYIYKYVPCVSWYILVLNELFTVHLKFKFNWASGVFIC